MLRNKKEAEFDISFVNTDESLKGILPDEIKISNVAFFDSKIQTWCSDPNSIKVISKEEFKPLLKTLNEQKPIKVIVSQNGELLDQANIQIIIESNMYE